MPETAPLLPPQLLSELNSVILRVFQAIDDGSSRYVVLHGMRYFARAHLRLHHLQDRGTQIRNSKWGDPPTGFPHENAALVSA